MTGNEWQNLITHNKEQAMIKKVSIIYTVVSAAIMFVTFFVPGKASQVIFSTVAVSFPIALIINGAARDGKLGPLKIPIFIFLLVLEACSTLMIFFIGKTASAPMVAGLPAGAAVQLYGMFLSPLIIVSLAYGLTFESFSLREEDLREVDLLKERATGPTGGPR